MDVYSTSSGCRDAFVHTQQEMKELDKRRMFSFAT